MKTTCAEITGEGGKLSQRTIMRGIYALEAELGDRAKMEIEPFLVALIKYLCLFDATDKVQGTGGVEVSFLTVVLDEHGNTIPSGYQEKYVSWESVLTTFNKVTEDRDYKVSYRRVARAIAPLIKKGLQENQELRKFTVVGTPESNHFSIPPQYWWTCLSFCTDVFPVDEMSDQARECFMRVARMKYAKSKGVQVFDTRPGNADPGEMRTPQARAVEEMLAGIHRTKESRASANRQLWREGQQFIPALDTVGE